MEETYTKARRLCQRMGETPKLYTYSASLLAEACGRAGMTEEGLSKVSDALAHTHKTGRGTTRGSCIESRANCC